MNIVLLNGTVHIFELQPRSHKQASHGADIVLSGSQQIHQLKIRAVTYQTIQESWLLLAEASNESDDRYHSIDLDSFQGLCHSRRAAHFHHVFHTSSAWSETLCMLPPVQILLVVDDMICAKFLQKLSFLL